jgi:hypothetical protein
MPEMCRSCKGDIDWAMSEDGLKRNPIDHASADREDGNLLVWRDNGGILRYKYRRKGVDPGPGEHTAISHYATCPEAGQWRRRRAP